MLLDAAHLFQADNPLQAGLVAFYSFLRKSSLVVDCETHISPKIILCSDLRFERSFAYVTVRASKTIQFQERTFSLPLPRVPGSLLCPVTALVNHLRINNVPKTAPLFSVRSASKLRPVTYAQFSSFLAKVIKSVGLDPTNYSPHSFRRDGATFAFKSSVLSELIKAQGDWHSDCYLIYLEMTDKQKRAAAFRMAAAILNTII